MGTALFCLPLRPGLVLLHGVFEVGGVEASYMDHVSTVAAVPFLRQEVDEIGIATDPTITVALHPRVEVPTAEEIALLTNVDVRITEESGATVVGVPVDTDGTRLGVRSGW